MNDIYFLRNFSNLLTEDINIFLKPIFSTSITFFEIFCSGLTSPFNPTSPIKQEFFNIGKSILEDKIDATTDKSKAGSVT